LEFDLGFPDHVHDVLQVPERRLNEIPQRQA